MKHEGFNIVLIACVATMLVVVTIGIKHFDLNQQAWDMWRNFGDDPFSALVIGHPHGLRYIVYYPSFVLSQILHGKPDLIFSYVCVVALVLISILSGRILYHLGGNSNYALRRDFVTIAAFSLSYVMNGRLIFPFLGYLLIIFVGVEWLSSRRWTIGMVFALFIGVLVTSLSSGTLLVAMALASGIVLITALRNRELFFCTPQLTISVVIVLLLFSIPAEIGLIKNFRYFGGDPEAIVRMLNHGSGHDIAASLGENIDAVEQDDSDTAGLSARADKYLQYWWIVAILAGTIAWSRGWRPVRMLKAASPGENVLHLAVALAMVGGLFGYSILTLCIVPVLILGSDKAVTAVRLARSRLFSTHS